jgi:glycosyltransferase involved in cell wall biosynthesis
MKKLAILASHPVYYQTPLWAGLAKEEALEVKVFFENKMAVGEYYDPEFGKLIEWNLPLFEGYEHQFIKSTLGFLLDLKRGNFDALLVNSWNSRLAWIAIFAAKALGIKVLLRAENPWNQEKTRKGMKQAFRRFALLSLFSMVSAFLYIGEENKEFYLRYGRDPKKLFSTPYALDNPRLLKSVPDPALVRHEVRKQLNISEDAVVVLSVGKLIPKKRPLDVLKAYEEMTVLNKALIFIGEGELRGELERCVSEKDLKNVHFAGFVGQNEVGRYYVSSDIFVLASGRGETWGLVVNEALCFGLPVILSDIVGSGADLVRPGENGFIVPCGAILGLAQKLDLLASNPSLRKEFSHASYSIIGDYTYQKDIQGILRSLE